MARPRNPAHRAALLTAATQVIAAEGLTASTAAIAQQAGVSAGTLFVYFESKSVLINELYVELKSEMGSVASEGLSASATPREQLRFMWDHWLLWALDDPDKRRALAHLAIAEDLTDESRQAVHRAYEGIASLLGDIAAEGPMRDTSLTFVLTLMSAIADATIDDLIQAPDPTGTRSSLAFDAMWRALAG